MKKTFKRIISVLLTVLFVCGVPVFAGAEGECFDITSVTVKAVDGNWKSDYVETLEITVKGNISAFVASGVVVSFGNEATGMRAFDVNSVSVKGDGDTAVITFDINSTLSQSEEYSIVINSGVFTSADGKLNNSYTKKLSGNLIIETLDIENIPVNPIEKLIIKINKWKYGWALKPVVLVLEWFLSL